MVPGSQARSFDRAAGLSKDDGGEWAHRRMGEGANRGDWASGGEPLLIVAKPHRMIGQQRLELLRVCSAGGSRERLSARIYRWGVRVCGWQNDRTAQQ